MTALYFSCHEPCSDSHPLAKQTDVAISSSQAQGYPAFWRPASLLQAICKTITTHVWIDIQGLLKVTVIAFSFPSTWRTYIHLYRSASKGICNKIPFLTLLYAGRIDYFPMGVRGVCVYIEVTCSFVLVALKEITETVVPCGGRDSSEWGKIWT